MSVWVAENLGHAFVKICCAVCGRVAHFHPQQTFLKATMQSSANLETQVNSTNSTASPSDETNWKPIWKDVFSSVQLLSHVRLFVTLWTAACQASLSITNSRGPPKTMSIESVIPSNHLILCHPLLLLPSIFPIIRVFQMSQLFASGGQSIQASVSASALPKNIKGWFSLGLTCCTPCCPRDPQESSPTPHFKIINSSVLSFLYSPTLTFIHDHWKNHSLD